MPDSLQYQWILSCVPFWLLFIWCVRQHDPIKRCWKCIIPVDCCWSWWSVWTNDLLSSRSITALDEQGGNDNRSSLTANERRGDATHCHARQLGAKSFCPSAAWSQSLRLWVPRCLCRNGGSANILIRDKPAPEDGKHQWDELRIMPSMSVRSPRRAGCYSAIRESVKASTAVAVSHIHCRCLRLDRQLSTTGAARAAMGGKSARWWLASDPRTLADRYLKRQLKQESIIYCPGGATVESLERTAFACRYQDRYLYWADDAAWAWPTRRFADRGRKYYCAEIGSEGRNFNLQAADTLLPAILIL